MNCNITKQLGRLVLGLLLFSAPGLGNSLFAQTYCIPSYSYDCSSGDRISNVTLAGVSTTINNTTGCSPANYGDYTNLAAADLVPGLTYSISVSSDYSSPSFEDARVWIDYNNNGLFEATEEIANTNGNGLPGGTGTFSFTVPSTAAAGTVRMRVRLVYSGGANIDPCNSVSYGETEDYNVSIISLTPCSGTPSAGAIAEGDTLKVCSGVAFSLTDTGFTIAGNMTYQWQQRNPSGTGTWTNIGGATNSLLNRPAGIISQTDYRFYVVCSNSSSSDTSAPITVALLPGSQCYCTPTYSYSCSSGDRISNVSLTGFSVNLNNSTGCSPNGYGDFTNLPAVDLVPGLSYTLSVSTDYGGPTYEEARIWIDYNNNGLFEASEQIGNTNGNGFPASGTATFNFTVPPTASAGIHRMRVRLVYNGGANIDPCNLATYGETEDYNVSVISLTPCSGTPNAGAIDETDTFYVCSGVPFSLLDTGFTVAGNMSYQWQMRSPAGSGNWTNIAGGVNSLLSMANGITSSADFRFYVSCSNSNQGDTSAMVTALLNPANECYCIPTTTGGSSYYISGFTTTGGTININNSPTGGSPTGYTDYHLTDSVVAMLGTTINFTALGSSGTFGHAIWVDWNEDGVFQPSEQEVSSNSYQSSPITGSFALPYNVSPGRKRMRVVLTYVPSNPSDPCNNTSDGEYEDYTLVALPLPDCSAENFPSGVTATANRDTLCQFGNHDVGLDIDTAFNLDGITYQWQQSYDGVTGWTNIGTPLLYSAQYVTTNVDTPMFFRCLVLCQSNTVITSSLVSVILSDPNLLSVTDSGRCGPGVVYLGATATPGSALNWYADSVGGTSLGSGSVFQTPALNGTDTFWVEASAGGVEKNGKVGTGISTITSPSPYYHLYDGNKIQMLYTAAELQAAGFLPGLIEKIGFKTVGAAAMPLTNFTVKMGSTNNTSLTTTWETGLVTVFQDPSYIVVSGMNEYSLSSPYFWDGSSNLIVETCFNNNTWASGYPSVEYTTVSFNGSHYNSQDGNANFCASPGGSNSTSTSRPNLYLSINPGCQSERWPVVAHITDKPTVDLGADINQCVDSGTSVTLDPGSQPAGFQFNWDDNSTSPVRQVNQSGTYYVVVDNGFGCSNSDTINVILRTNPKVDLGPDTFTCNNVVITLDAGSDGTTYFWNTGENTRTIQVDQSGTYVVIVSNAEGCSVADSIEVDMSGLPPYFDGIHIRNNGVRTFVFTALSPENIVGYEWDFGDGSPHAFSAAPTHTYLNDGNYIVTLRTTSGCGSFVDSMAAHVLGINALQVDPEEVYVYPNPTKNKTTIVAKDLKMEKIVIYNTLGQKVYEKAADSWNKHELNMDQMASGLYSISIFTDQGMVLRKLSIER